VLEREEGFPKIDPLFNGRYLPAVVAFLERREGLRKSTPFAADGAETWGDENARSIGNARPTATPAQGRKNSTLLERREAQPEGDGLPRFTDPFTRRRHARGDPGLV
jgi:hypothetical protein